MDAVQSHAAADPDQAIIHIRSRSASRQSWNELVRQALLLEEALNQGRQPHEATLHLIETSEVPAIAVLGGALRRRAQDQREDPLVAVQLRTAASGDPDVLRALALQNAFLKWRVGNGEGRTDVSLLEDAGESSPWYFALVAAGLISGGLADTAHSYAKVKPNPNGRSSAGLEELQTRLLGLGLDAPDVRCRAEIAMALYRAGFQFAAVLVEQSYCELEPCDAERAAVEDAVIAFGLL